MYSKDWYKHEYQKAKKSRDWWKSAYLANKNEIKELKREIRELKSVLHVASATMEFGKGGK